MIEIIDKSQCSGCTACASVCPVNAIVMQADSSGFFYPKVNEEKCIKCDLCEKVCAFNENYDKSQNLDIPKIYAVRHKNLHEVETSRSGAAFIAISDYVLESGGIIYGAGYGKHFSVIHKRAITKEERDEFKGSKYVQSDLDTIFPQVKKDLKNGRLVLFSGTPCQTAGLNSYIGKKLRNNLILVDIICHGVPSPKMWNDYLSYIENRYRKEILVVNFRDKSRIGWDGHLESIVFNDKTKIELDNFTYLFSSALMHRPSCFKCYYTNYSRPSDFTLGDYWGWQRLSSTFNVDNKGCSLLFLNTEKACAIFEKIEDRINYIPSTKELCFQKHLKEPTKKPLNYDNFHSLYIKKGFIRVANKYGNLGFLFRLKKYMKKSLYPIWAVVKKR